MGRSRRRRASLAGNVAHDARCALGLPVRELVACPYRGRSAVHRVLETPRRFDAQGTAEIVAPRRRRRAHPKIAVRRVDTYDGQRWARIAPRGARRTNTQLVYERSVGITLSSRRAPP